MRPLGSEVTLTINAPQHQVWALVTDVTRIGEFSPETFEAEWTRGSTGPEAGATFRGHVKRNGIGPIYWVPCKVTVCEPERLFEFTVIGGRRINNWGYRLTPVDADTTAVTEYFRLEDALPIRLYWALLGHWRAKTNERGMRTTLERMKAVLEA